jgi:hypothetical protein
LSHMKARSNQIDEAWGYVGSAHQSH